MMNEIDDKENLRRRLFRLREKVDCQRCFRCIYESVKDICKAQYEAHADSMRCLDESAPNCNMALEAGNFI